MGDKLIMNKKERERKVIMSGYGEGRYTLIEAAERMLVSYRQAKRIWSRYNKNNDIGLVHKSRGRSSTRALDAGFKKTVLELYQEKYNGFGATFAVEKRLCRTLGDNVERPCPTKALAKCDMLIAGLGHLPRLKFAALSKVSA